jgi:hypothetical protein
MRRYFQKQWHNLCLHFKNDPKEKVKRLLIADRQKDALRISGALLQQRPNDFSTIVFVGSVGKACRNSFLWYEAYRKLRSLNDEKNIGGIFNDFQSDFHPCWRGKRKNVEYTHLLEIFDLIKRRQYNSALNKLDGLNELSKKQWQAFSAKARCYYEIQDPRFCECLLALGRENFLAPELKKLLRETSEDGITICLLYSTEKTGNQTILHSLVRSEKFFTLLVLQHTLNNNLDKAANHAAHSHDWGAMYNQLRTGILYRDFLFSYHLPKKRKLKIITLVREPVSMELSRYFFLNENIYGIKVDDSADHFLRFMREELESSESPITWFDRELKNNFGFDIYQQKFDKHRGYQIYDHNNVEILVMKLENLNEVFVPAIKDLLGIKNIPIVRKNDSSDHRYATKYNHLKSTLKLERQELDELYKTPWVQQFYTTKEIGKFIKKWSK